MPRQIKRYGSRKLYDTGESRYVSLDELAGMIRDGENIQVVDNASGEDATAAVLTQVIADEGRRGGTLLSKGFLHDVIRIGERAYKASEQAVEAGAQKIKASAGEIVQRQAQRFAPTGRVAEMRDEMERLRQRLEALEHQLDAVEPSPEPTPSASPSEDA